MLAALVKSFGGPECINVEEIAVPDVGPDEILVKVHCTAVNPVDGYIRSGSYIIKPKLPYVPGLEGAGEISKVGPNVFHLKEGDHVWFVNALTGASAEYALTSANLTFILPNNISFEQGASLGVSYVTAYRALFVKAGAQAGQSVFIHGISGGVGLAACQIAKTHGLHVYGSASSDQGAESATNFGAKQIFNHKEANYVQKICAQFPNGFDIILEMLADTNLSSDLTLINKFGRIVVIGSNGNIEINPRSLILKESVIVGVFSSLGDVSDYQRIAERINGLLSGGHIRPFVGKILPLSQISLAHQLVVDRSTPKLGRILIQIVKKDEQPGHSVQEIQHTGDMARDSNPDLPVEPTIQTGQKDDDDVLPQAEEPYISTDDNNRSQPNIMSGDTNTGPTTVDGDKELGDFVKVDS